jgi:hypothetical protein
MFLYICIKKRLKILMKNSHLTEVDYARRRFYEKADGLVGICRDTVDGHSKVFTLNLSQFEAVA